MMIKNLILIALIGFLISCKQAQESVNTPILWESYNDSAGVAANADHDNERMRYVLVQSKVLDKNEVFLPLYEEVSKMTTTQYEALKPLILEKDINTLQQHIADGALSYESLVLFYLYRIYHYELNPDTTLNTIISLNKNVVSQARELDRQQAEGKVSPGRHPIYGMPILLKDNINTQGMKTTAGSIALIDNAVDDAYIVKRLKNHGALILGKVNLSEWAYFLCSGCPLGYSAVGGQTLNPYGRGIFETGGSSSGSGTAVAANYAVAAVGTETSGSILSPSSQNSVVGLKPTVGLLSRTGIVPISSTLDTPGPMTKNVTDNAILLSAMLGHDASDSKSVNQEFPDLVSAGKHPENLSDLRLGAMTTLLESDSIYRDMVSNLKKAGAAIIEFTPPDIQLEGFISILNLDMREDLPKYLETHADPKMVKIKSIADAVAFNNADSLLRIPYGQALFEGILTDSTTAEGLMDVKTTLEEKGRLFFDTAMDEHDLDAVLSINNYHAGYAAVAKYPALTVPMGYKTSGEPINLTFIGKPFSEAHLLRMGRAFEDKFPERKMPKGFE